MRVTTFASGSTGNCTLLRCGETNILLDAGISMRRIAAGLAAQGLTPQALSGVFITHAHSDHIMGLRVLSRKHGLPIHASPETAEAICASVPEAAPYVSPLPPDLTVTLGGEMEITAFPTMHDAPGSVGYIVRGGGAVFGLCTDLGCVTEPVRQALFGAEAVVLEANHDEEMLRQGPYPAYLKQRILSQRGHLSNALCGELAAELAEHGTRLFVLGHLSRENNTPALAKETVARALSGRARLAVAPMAEPLTVEFGEQLC